MPVELATTPRPGDPIRLALRAREAARALGISERTLWGLTNQGLIPHIRLRRAVLYPTDQLRAWLAEKATKGTK